jgi:hypothetical protein
MLTVSTGDAYRIDTAYAVKERPPIPQGKVFMKKQATGKASGIAGRGRTALSYAFLAALALLSAAPQQAAASAFVQPFFVNITQTINWMPGDPILPTDTFTGESFLTRGNFVNTVFFPDAVFGGQMYSGIAIIPQEPYTVAIPGNPILPQESLIWQFGGAVHTAQGDFPTCAFSPGTSIPVDPCTPDITLALALNPGFAPIHLSGSIYAFDAPVVVGTWDISITPAPEPAALVLLAIGFAAFAMQRRHAAT